MTKLTRRQFLKLSGAAASAALVGAGCTPPPPTPTPTPSAMPWPTVTPLPTAIPSPTASPTPRPIRRPELIKFYPAAPSRVVQTHHAGVWQDKNLSPAALRQMLDASITKLTGLNDAQAAWAALFAPDEKIAIKVNTFRNSAIWTHAPLVQAVTDSLQDAGIPAEQITLFDFFGTELKTAGFTVNPDGPGVRCSGTDNNYTSGWKVNGRNLQLSNHLLECDALINMPVLKAHMIAGITFALKNHYGSFSNPESLHGNIGQALAELNALPPIKDKTRLIIGDALEACLNYGYGWPYWTADWQGDFILMSFDPVAHDTVGLQMLTQLREESQAIVGMATPGLESSAALGLGTNDPANMEFLEETLA